jgi:hypothetical protein
MKNHQIIIALVSCTLVLFPAFQIFSGRALGSARDETLPPGENTERLEWIEVPFADPFYLISCSKAVQKELGVTPKQLDQLQSMEPLFRSELRELSYRKDPVSQNGIQRHINAARNGIGRILKRDQLKRLRQLLLQLHGPCSVVKDSRLSALLKITDRQAREIDSIVHGLKVKSKRINLPGRNDNGQARESSASDASAKQIQMQQLLKSLNSEVYKVFSDEQKNLYKKAKGEPFEFKREEDTGCLGDDTYRQ